MAAPINGQVVGRMALEIHARLKVTADSATPMEMHHLGDIEVPLVWRDGKMVITLMETLADTFGIDLGWKDDPDGS